MFLKELPGVKQEMQINTADAMVLEAAVSREYYGTQQAMYKSIGGMSSETKYIADCIRCMHPCVHDMLFEEMYNVDSMGHMKPPKVEYESTPFVDVNTRFSDPDMCVKLPDFIDRAPVVDHMVAVPLGSPGNIEYHMHHDAQFGHFADMTKPREHLMVGSNEIFTNAYETAMADHYTRELDMFKKPVLIGESKVVDTFNFFVDISRNKPWDPK